MVATTAVVAGTAGAVQHHQQQKYAAQDAQAQAAAQAQAPAPEEYAAPAPEQYAPAPAAAPATSDLVAQINQLNDLKAAGILSEEEFAAAKAKLLA